MKHKLVALGIVVLAMVAIGTRLAEAQTSDWTYASPENGVVVVSEMTEVRYGAEGACGYRYATVSSNIPCSNAYFGDPCVGTLKHCDTRPAGTANGPYYAIPAWAQTLPSSTRFIVLSNMFSQAVLDKETGLVWERYLDSSAPYTYTWYKAQLHCNDLTLGNRKGWRMPTVQELASLLDPSVPSPDPKLPPGHPFIFITGEQWARFWSATTYAPDPDKAWVVLFDEGWVTNGPAKSHNFAVWCVRGGQGVDPQ